MGLACGLNGHFCAFRTVLAASQKLLHFFSRQPMVSLKLLNIELILGLGVEYLFFVSSHSLKTREKYTNWDNLVCRSLYIFWGKWVYDKIHTYVKKIHLALSSFKNWKVNKLPSKNIQTETN